MADLRTKTEHLLSDAKVWQQALDDLNGPRAAIGPLTLNGADDLTGLGDRMDIDQTYEDARQALLTLMGEAQSYFGGIAGALVDAAQMYTDDDTKFAKKLAEFEKELDV